MGAGGSACVHVHAVRARRWLTCRLRRVVVHAIDDARWARRPPQALRRLLLSLNHLRLRRGGLVRDVRERDRAGALADLAVDTFSCNDASSLSHLATLAASSAAASKELWAHAARTP